MSVRATWATCACTARSPDTSRQHNMVTAPVEVIMREVETWVSVSDPSAKVREKSCSPIGSCFQSGMASSMLPPNSSSATWATVFDATI